MKRLFIFLLLGFWAAPVLSQEKETDWLSQVRQLTFEGARSGEGYFSPDGSELVFQSEREKENPFYQIYLLNLKTGDTRRLSPGTGKTTCAFIRPGADEILFASTHEDPSAVAQQKAEFEFRASGKQRRYSWDYDETMELYTVRRDGTRIKRLTTSPGYDAEGAYSPDGKLIVFCSIRQAYPKTKLSAEDQKKLELDPATFAEIYLMKADGSGVKRLTDWPGYDGGPFFSPDGSRIIWRHFSEDGLTADIFTMKLDGTDRRQLTDFKSMAWAPYFHPSGKYAIFTSNKEGFSNFELYLVDAEGKKTPQRVTFTDGFDGLPVFSPDGKQLCWTTTRGADGKSQLFLAQWNHERALQVLGLSEAAAPPAPKSKPLPKPKAPKTSTDITLEDLQQTVHYLASDALEGRLTGTQGARDAATFIAAELKKAGLKPGWSNSFFQPFAFNSGVELVPGSNSLSGTVDGQFPAYALNQDFRPLAFSSSDSVEGDVVFVGYGLSTPGTGPKSYDSYAGLDVKGKIVLVFRYVPEGVPPERRLELNRYAGLRYKAMMARERGAKALLVVSGPNSPNAGELLPLNFDNGSSSGLPVLSISGKVVETWFAKTGKSLKEFQSSLDQENPHAQHSVALPVKLLVKTGLQQIKQSDQNVLAYLPPAREKGDERYLILGGHYDHLGRGDVGAFGHAGEENAIHNGADDNASGIALLLEIASQLSVERKKNPRLFSKGILFAFWSGEEMGLLGSSWFADHPGRPLTNAIAYFNFDMVGRLRENKLQLQGLGSSPEWKALIEKRNIPAGFNLVLQDDPYLPTDTSSLYPKKIPVLSFFTGSHEEYHRPTDDPPTLNYDGLLRITQFARQLALDLVSSTNTLTYQKVEPSTKGGGSRETLRAYLGTIPDYAGDAKGVKISGVRAGSPAEKAGLKGGDIIVELGTQKIVNIYDYTYALDAVKIGQPVDVVVERGGKRITVPVTPEARK